VDITPVMEQKREAMGVMKAQSYLPSCYAELASRRGNHARRISGMEEVKYPGLVELGLPIWTRSQCP
jgi:4-oxalomesaconate hydratase